MSFEQKAIVKIDSDGAVAKCAKGLASGECGYKAGAKVCGKCGAMAVEVKMVPVDAMTNMDDDDMEEDIADEQYGKMMKMRRRKEMNAAMGMSDDEMDDEEDGSIYDYLEPMDKGMGVPAPASANPELLARSLMKEEMGMEDEEEIIEEDMSDEQYGKMMRMRRQKEMNLAMGMGEDEDLEDDDLEDDEEMPMATPKGMGYGKRGLAYKEDDEEMMDEEDDDMMPMRPTASGMAPDLEAARMKRLRSLGTKSADIGLNGFMCAVERKVYPGSISVYDDCPGGCVAERGLPGLLHVEGLAETMFKGAVIDSGYSSEADMFVVDVQTKSGYVNEVFIDGTTAEVLGFHRLDDSVFEQKSLMDDVELIDFNEAAEIAINSYFNSFLKNKKNINLGIARAGNVIGGGDWSKDRLIPDCVRSWSKNRKAEIRNPNSTRPWQHVLEAVWGYIFFASKLKSNNNFNGEAFNFGPKSKKNYKVSELLNIMRSYLSEVYYYYPKKRKKFNESKLLKLNCFKAKKLLKWKSVLNFDETAKLTADWYYSFYFKNKRTQDISIDHIKYFENIFNQRN